MAVELAYENVWLDKWRYEEAERQFHEKKCIVGSGLGPLASQIAKAREDIKKSLDSGRQGGLAAMPTNTDDVSSLKKLVTVLSSEVKELHKSISMFDKALLDMSSRLASLERAVAKKFSESQSTLQKKEDSPIQNPQKVEADEEEEDIDLFGSDDEDEEAARVREERLKEYEAKKLKKPGPIAKSSVLLDCKPWDDETDMKMMEMEVRKIEMDGLKWGASKLVPLAYGIHKLQILCTVEDEKVSIDDLTEQMEAIEDYVQSVDVAAFNKI